MAHSPREIPSSALHKLDLRDPFWPAQVTVALAIVLYVSLPGKLTLGPGWLLPSLEAVLLLALVVATPHPDVRLSPVRRQMAMTLIGLVSAVNLVSLGLLAHFLLRGGNVDGHALILAGAVLWITNVLIFGLWFWEIDGGGPVQRALTPEAPPDFAFIQLTDPSVAEPGWRPGYLDYMYTSLTNATAFSPTDTMPLTYKAKSLMGVQSLVSLITLGLIVARAVNILK